MLPIVAVPVQDDARRRRTEHTSFAFLAHLGRLQHLSLQLPLRGLPAPVWMLTDLRSLVLRGASDLAFPDEFAQLEELTRLELLECGLERVPPVVCRCEGVLASPLDLACALRSR